MARSRSSFELDRALEAAASLASEPQARPERARRPAHAEPPPPPPAEAPLVSFAPSPAADRPATAPPPSSFGAAEMTPPPSSVAATGLGLKSALPPSGDDAGAASAPAATAHDDPALHARGPRADERRFAPEPPAEPPPERALRSTAPPSLPDLTAVVSPVLRCEKVVEWITDVTGAIDVFLADAAGLPIAGAIRDSEARLAGSGWVAAAVASLSSALPGAPSQEFALHVGEGPVFQLVGFQVGAATYVVGLVRAVPLTVRQAHGIRVACRLALGEAPGDAAGVAPDLRRGGARGAGPGLPGPGAPDVEGAP